MEFVLKNEYILQRELKIHATTANEKFKKRLCLIVIELFFRNNWDRHEIIKTLNMSRDDVTHILECSISNVSVDTVLEAIEKLSKLDPSLEDTIKRLELV